jgi:hypothetical protein
MTAAVREYLKLVENEVHGFRTTWELATANGLSPGELVTLASRLKLFEPRVYRDERGYRIEAESAFTLRPKERRAVAVRLFEAGEATEKARRELGISKSTWWRIGRESEGHSVPKGGSAPSVHAGSRVSKRTSHVGARDRRSASGRRPLSFSSSGTPWDEHRQILELIGAA